MAVSWSGGAMAGQSVAQRCEVRKNLAAGAQAKCLAEEYAQKAQGGTADFGRCDAAFARAFEMAERQARPGGCATEGDAAAVDARVDACMAGVAGALAGQGGASPCPASELPATGQTTCWNASGTAIACAGTGQDGDIRAGRALSYTDNGDGTITDNTTGLMWEKKSLDGSLHNASAVYTWESAFAFIVQLNAGSGFAGHTDWRLPNAKELQSIVNFEHSGPAVSPAFNTGCVEACTVLTCSCTAWTLAPGSNQPFGYWSSTTVARGPKLAWFVVFVDGSVVAGDTGDLGFKGFTMAVRAVRGGR